MIRQSISKKLESYNGSSVIELITSAAVELGVEPKDVTIEFYDNIDGTVIEVECISNEKSELA